MWRRDSRQVGINWEQKVYLLLTYIHRNYMQWNKVLCTLFNCACYSAFYLMNTLYSSSEKQNWLCLSDALWDGKGGKNCSNLYSFLSQSASEKGDESTVRFTDLIWSTLCPKMYEESSSKALAFSEIVYKDCKHCLVYSASVWKKYRLTNLEDQRSFLIDHPTERKRFQPRGFINHLQPRKQF